MSFVVLGSLRSTRVSLKLEEVFTERVKNLYAAKSACLFALNRIQINAADINKADEKKAEPPELFDKDTESEFDPKAPWTPNPEPYLISIGDLGCDVYIEDEGGKINLNFITDVNTNFFLEFLASKEIEPMDAETITDSIIDWKDEDDLHHINGAETPYYQDLPEPYEAKNAPFDSIEELMLVKGVTPFIFEDIRDGITVFGTGQINVNFASREILVSIPGIDNNAADEILNHIEKNGQIHNDEELRALFFSIGIAGGAFEDIKKYLTLNVQNFVTIRSVCSSSIDVADDAVKHQYRIIAEISPQAKRILAVYPD